MRAVRPTLSWRARMRGAVSIALATLVVTGILGTAPAAAEDDPGGEQRLADLVDAERGARGLAPLRVCAELRGIARRWSDTMAADGTLSHNSRLGEEVEGWRSIGDNVGYDSSADAVHRRLMESGAHRDHILSVAYTEVGFGVERAGGRTWVTEVFREPDGSAPCTVVPRDPNIVVACPPGTVPSAAFADTRGNTHREAIDCGAWYGITHGTGDGRYSPRRELDRGQMATFLANVVERTDATLPEPSDQGFTDIAGSTHADAINQLAEVGIVEGTSTSTYEPTAPVTRGLMASALVRAYTFASSERLAAQRDWFSDDNGRPDETAINQAAGAGLVSGMSATQYAPDQIVRRDQLASYLARTLSRLVERGDATRPR